MNHRIRKNGELYLVSLPDAGIQALNLREGGEMAWTVEGHKLVLQRKDNEVTEAFMELAKQVADENDAVLRALKDR